MIPHRPASSIRVPPKRTPSILLAALSLCHHASIVVPSAASTTWAARSWNTPHVELLHPSKEDGRSLDNRGRNGDDDNVWGALCESDFWDDDVEDNEGGEEDGYYCRGRDFAVTRSFPRGGGRRIARTSRRSSPRWQQFQFTRRRGSLTKLYRHRRSQLGNFSNFKNFKKSTIPAAIPQQFQHQSDLPRQIQTQTQTQIQTKAQTRTESQKLRQWRKSFRRKQRAFQDAMYQLNSRLHQRTSHDAAPFPPPPYRQWQMAPEPPPGKTSLTGRLFLANVLVFGLQAAFPSLTSWGAKRSDLLLQGRQLHRLVTPLFLHGGIGHLLANSYSLRNIGIDVERSFGPTRFLATYLVSGMAGNVLSAIRSPHPAVGASGAIFGLVGAQYTFLARNADLFGYVGRRQKAQLLETVGLNLALGMTNPMVDNWGHLGGFVGGVGMAWLVGPKLYVARVPTTSAGGREAVIVDRPMLAMRMPEVLEQSVDWMEDNMRRWGACATTSFERLQQFLGNEMRNNGRMQNREFVFVGSDNGTDANEINIVKTRKSLGDIPLEGNIYVNPTDGFRQDVSELDPSVIRQRERQRQRMTSSRRAAPRPGRSIRPRYGHLYR